MVSARRAVRTVPCSEHKALLVHCEELREQLARTEGENGNLRRRVAELRENVKQLQEVVVVDRLEIIQIFPAYFGNVDTSEART